VAVVEIGTVRVAKDAVFAAGVTVPLSGVGLAPVVVVSKVAPALGQVMTTSWALSTKPRGGTKVGVSFEPADPAPLGAPGVGTLKYAGSPGVNHSAVSVGSSRRSSSSALTFSPRSARVWAPAPSAAPAALIGSAPPAADGASAAAAAAPLRRRPP
jgi:hypothetical protein